MGFVKRQRINYIIESDEQLKVAHQIMESCGLSNRRLGLAIAKYEARRFPIADPTPIQAIRFRMEQLDLVQADLCPYLGSPSKVSETLSGKVPLNLDKIKKLSKALDIPIAVLVGPLPDVPPLRSTGLLLNILDAKHEIDQLKAEIERLKCDAEESKA